MKSYFFPCNLEKYDILGSFLKNGFVDYGTKLNIELGDTVYIYTGAPYSAIFLKCKVRNILKEEETINDDEFLIDKSINFSGKSKYLRLIPEKNYLSKIDKVNSDTLKDKGLKGFSFQVALSCELVEYLESI